MTAICKTCGREKLSSDKPTPLEPTAVKCDPWCDGFFLDPPPAEHASTDCWMNQVWVNDRAVRFEITCALRALGTRHVDPNGFRRLYAIIQAAVVKGIAEMGNDRG